MKESLACNLPIVVTSCGNVSDRLQGVRACHVCSRDPRELGSRLAQVVARRERSNGREHVYVLTLDRVARSIITSYERVLGPRTMNGLCPNRCG